jgi:putative ATP-dependent endonuclease of OLD family
MPICNIGGFTGIDDVPDLVAEAVYIGGGGQSPWAGMDEDKKSKKISNAKRRLNTDAVTQMTLAELTAIDPTNEIIGWFQLIGARL